MNRLLLLLSCFFLVFASSGQSIYFTKTGQINFFSSTPIEDIEAENLHVIAAMDIDKNIIEFKMKISDFKFEKSLMEEHFNENYLESDKFPSATFKGKFQNFDSILISKQGTYKTKVSGELNIHGVSKDIIAEGNVVVSENGIKLISTFKVQLVDYKIKIPNLVVTKIAEEISINVNVNLKALK